MIEFLERILEEISDPELRREFSKIVALYKRAGDGQLELMFDEQEVGQPTGEFKYWQHQFMREFMKTHFKDKMKSGNWYSGDIMDAFLKSWELAYKWGVHNENMSWKFGLHKELRDESKRVQTLSESKIVRSE